MNRKVNVFKKKKLTWGVGVGWGSIRGWGGGGGGSKVWGMGDKKGGSVGSGG